MAVSQMTRLTHQFAREDGCSELMEIADEVIVFEQGQIEHLKNFL